MTLLSYVTCLRSLDKVVKTCFGQDLDPNFEAIIQEFRINYLDLDIPITPKIHGIFYHVPEFCRISNSGLALFSEQASEAVHTDFESVWNNYKLTNLEHPKYKKQFLKAVQMYNSRHF